MLTISLERAAEAFSICKNKFNNDFFLMQITYYYEFVKFAYNSKRFFPLNFRSEHKYRELRMLSLIVAVLGLNAIVVYSGLSRFVYLLIRIV